MVCSNNRKYIKNLDIVRKCGCTKKCYWLKDATTQLYNSSLDTNLEKHNITILSNDNINYSNISNSNSNNNNISFSDSIKITEELFNSFTKSKIRENSRVNAKVSNQETNIDDYVSEYETEDNEDSYESELQERMQLNPSTDDYYDDEEYDDNEDEDDEAELLPEAKELVQLSVNDRTQEDEEDMGYDEDDERIAIAVERPKELRSHVKSNKDFASREGSGGNGGKNLHRSYKEDTNDRFRFDHMNSYRRKQEKIFTDHQTHINVGVVPSDVDLRESSGNFANDDEDNDDESDDDDDSDGFFNSKRKSSSRYFRKNTNDAIKIISTPLGKVGIVYQQTPTQIDEKNTEDVDKKSTSFTDFDALSPDPESSHRLASSHPKITPVLTPDGKVALLYRGDSENSKYEPIRNLTSHKFNNNQEPNSDRKSLGSSINTDPNSSSDYSDADSAGDTEEEKDLNTSENNNNMKTNGGFKVTTDEQAAILPAPEAAPTTGSFIIRPTDSVLPMINRPLSEVLGIKKNQFKQFRIKDTSSTTEASLESLAAVNMDSTDTNTLHFLTKVNLANYPTSSRTRNYDFDFSRDNTMLDERSRSKEHQTKSTIENNQQLVVGTNEPMNEEILSKTEVVNLAIIPHFDEELERLQRLREYEERRHHRQRQRQKQNEEDLSGIHCIMQAMMGIAAISTVFGMLGTFFKQRILDQLRLMHW